MTSVCSHSCTRTPPGVSVRDAKRVNRFRLRRRRPVRRILHRYRSNGSPRGMKRSWQPLVCPRSWTSTRPVRARPCSLGSNRHPRAGNTAFQSSGSPRSFRHGSRQLGLTTLPGSPAPSAPLLPRGDQGCGWLSASPLQHRSLGYSTGTRFFCRAEPVTTPRCFRMRYARSETVDLDNHYHVRVASHCGFPIRHQHHTRRSDSGTCPDWLYERAADGWGGSLRIPRIVTGARRRLRQ